MNEPSFKSYEDFEEYCVKNRKFGLKVLRDTRPYTPFIFGERDGIIQLCAGYFIIKKLTKALKPRRTGEYKAWRNSILNRDNYRCTKCGSRKNLHVHHINPVARNPRKSTDMENGITLCSRCHKKEHQQNG